MAERPHFKDLLQAKQTEVDVEPLLRQLGLPLLLARGRNRGLPRGHDLLRPDQAEISPDFVAALRDFCEALPG